MFAAQKDVELKLSAMLLSIQNKALKGKSKIYWQGKSTRNTKYVTFERKYYNKYQLIYANAVEILVYTFWETFEGLFSDQMELNEGWLHKDICHHQFTRIFEQIGKEVAG